MRALLAIALGGCWTGPVSPAVLENAAGPPARIVRVPRRAPLVPAKRPPPSLSPAQRRFPPELRAVRDDAYACARRHGVSIAHLLQLEVTIDGAGHATTARATGFGAADPCVVHALLARTYRDHTGTTITITIPWSSGHPPP